MNKPIASIIKETKILLYISETDEASEQKYLKSVAVPVGRFGTAVLMSH